MYGQVLIHPKFNVQWLRKLIIIFIVIKNWIEHSIYNKWLFMPFYSYFFFFFSWTFTMFLFGHSFLKMLSTLWFIFTTCCSCICGGGISSTTGFLKHQVSFLTISIITCVSWNILVLSEDASETTVGTVGKSTSTFLISNNFLLSFLT